MLLSSPMIHLYVFHSLSQDVPGEGAGSEERADRGEQEVNAPRYDHVVVEGYKVRDQTLRHANA